MGFGAVAVEYVEKNAAGYEQDLKDFCSIPSVSTLREHRPDVHRAAKWLAKRLQKLGVSKVSIIETTGHPVVYAKTPYVEGRPVILVYGHYDVQPTDPIDEWDSPPFEPTVRGDCLYARGVADMKAQIIAVVASLEALKQECGQLPLNVTFLLEGEEEIGSPSLPAFVDAHRSELACDVVLNCDGGIHGPETPSITYGLRGLAYFEIEICGPRSDLHSGVFGGAVENPALVLCRLIAGMIDANGQIQLPGFYDSVLPLTQEERAELARVPLSEEDWKRFTGVPAVWGEPEYTIVERTGARPSLDVNGIFGGFTGQGSKTVLPARATAKISMRLVPDQRGEEVADQLRAYLREHAPKTVRWEVRSLNYAMPVVVKRDSVFMRAAVSALETVFGKKPLFKRDGGTIPVVGILKEKLGVDTVLLGFELPDAGFHGPNERMHLPTFVRGMKTFVRFFGALG